jgi:histidine triad (HIT) family protein
MTDNCEYCKKIEDSNAKVLYKDDKVIAFLEENPFAIGHVSVVPLEHYTIIEQVPDFIITHIFSVANKISTSAFESLGAHGTNILVNNGVVAGQDTPHFAVHVVPRRENDGINLQWPPKQLDEEEMSTVELSLKEETKNIGTFEKEEKEPVNVDEMKEGKTETLSEDDYLTRQINRIP